MRPIDIKTKNGPTTWEKIARAISIIAVILGLAGTVKAQSSCKSSPVQKPDTFNNTGAGEQAGAAAFSATKQNQR